MKKPFILLCIAFACSFQAWGQTTTIAGIGAPGNATPGGYFDIVFDRFGNQYSLSQIAVSNATRLFAPSSPTPFTPVPSTPVSSSAPTVAYTTCLPGYFRIYLETGCGMDLYATDATQAARLNVLCQVLTDIADFIPSPCTSTGQTVNIWVRAGLTSALGVATPFFNIPYSLTKTGITDNTVWETLNSGVDAFKNIAPPLYASGGGTTGTSGGATVYFHGSIALNFGGTVTWHTNLSTPPASGEEDLYTVALHEMMHVMGFCTLIDYNGRSVFDMYNVPPSPPTWQYYSRYDKQLQTAAGLPLINGSTSGCNLYQYSFNAAAAATPNAILSPGGLTAPGCSTGFYTSGGETSNTICATAIKYAGGFGLPIPVYTPACYEKGGSLSHFDDQCYVPSGFCPACATTNCEYFVMSNSSPSTSLGSYSATTNPGVMKRYLTPEERQVLCDIGYNVLTTFGNAANLNAHSYGGTPCPGRQVVGFNDGITTAGSYAFYTTSGSSVTISGPSLGTTILDNDLAGGVAMSTIGGSTFKCLEVMTGTGSVSASAGSATTNVIYTAGSTDYGVQLLRYVPVSSSGVEGNISYIYIFVGSGNCIPSPCNMVVNAGFENPSTGAYGNFLGSALVAGPQPENCWLSFNSIPSIAATDAPYLLDPADPGVYTIPNTYEFRNAGAHPLSSLPNNHFLILAGATQPPGWQADAIQEQLSAPLAIGTQYTISFWAILGGGGTDPFAIDRHPTHLKFLAGNSYPLVGVLNVPTGYMPAGYDTLAEFTIIALGNDYQWHYYSSTVTYLGPPTSAGILVIQSAPWDDDSALFTLPGFSDAVIGIDDISIVPTASACAFSMPGSINTNTPLFNLFTTASVCVDGGTFSWPTMPMLAGGIPTVSTSVTFNPLNAYEAAFAVGNINTIPVAYTYTTTAGCVQTVYTTVQISNRPKFTGGANQALTICGDVASVPVNSLLKISDIVPGQLETWHMISAPAHGVLIVSDTITSTGDTLTPSGLIYAPAVGFFGNDSFKIEISNCCDVSDTTTIHIFISPLPLAGTITGGDSVCVGSSMAMIDTASGGVWSCITGHATIVSGLVTGASQGNDTIKYTVSNACGTAVAKKSITIKPLPLSGTITGSNSVCIGSTMTLVDTILSGIWSSSSSATVSGGIVTGISSGSSVISYSVTNSCGTAIASHDVTVNALPNPGVITGTPDVCVGSSIALSDGITGGIWSSGNTGIATAGSSGIATGVSNGIANVSYIVSNICGTAAATSTVTVNPLPDAGAITGTDSVCVGTSVSLVDAESGGTWSSTNTSASVAAGLVTGLIAGMDTINYTVTNVCGTAFTTQPITVKPLADPGTITGSANVCAGSTIILTDGISGGMWNCSNGHAGVSLGIVTGITAGTDTISYAVANTCGPIAANKILTINPLPTAFTVTGGGSYCAGGIGLPVGLSGSNTGVSYQLYNTSSITGSPVAGTGAAFDFGLQLLPGAYTVLATNTATGCTNIMAGSTMINIDTLLSLIITANPDTLLYVGFPDTLTAVVSGAVAATYQWYINGNIVTGATGPVLTWNSLFNDDTVSCFVTDSGACGTSSISDYLVIHLENVGIENLSTAKNLSILPNPNNGTFTINLNSTVDEQAQVIITNTPGEVIQESYINTNRPTEIKLNVPAGIYFITVSTPAEKWNEKVLILPPQ